MMTDELSICGYCCTGRFDAARQPTSRMTRLTTSARTGCLMKTSVNRRLPVSVGPGELSPGASALCMTRILGGDGDQGALAQLERAGRRHRLARLQARDDQHLV